MPNRPCEKCRQPIEASRPNSRYCKSCNVDSRQVALERIESKLDRVLILLERYFELNPGFEGATTTRDGATFMPGSGWIGGGA